MNGGESVWSEAAAWVEAIGAIAAVIGAGWVAASESRATRRREERAEAAAVKREAKTALATKTAALNLSPPDLYKEAAAAFDELQKSASAAIALAMMNASHIKFCTQAFDGWEDFESALFQDGNIELPRFLEDQFNREFSAWLTNLDRLVKQCERRETSAHDAGGPDYQIENAVNALKHVVEMQGNEIGDRNDNGSLACSFLVTERLAAAFDKAWKTYGDLRRALDARQIPQAA